jgi:hypothetical protein
MELLLVFGILADYADDTLAPDNLAIIADLLD